MNDTTIYVAYHLTFSCYEKKWLFKSPVLYEMFLSHLENTLNAKNIGLFVYVIMPNHVHLIIHVKEDINFGKLLASIKRPFSYNAIRFLEIQFPEIHSSLRYKYGNRIGYRFWTPGKGVIKLIKTQIQLIKTAEYIHNNPIRRGLVENLEDWEWSSYNYWMHGSRSKIKLVHPEDFLS